MTTYGERGGIAPLIAAGKSAVDYYKKIGVPNHNASTSLTASYTYRVIKGLWLGAALNLHEEPNIPRPIR
jgi:hypothetical protein